MHKPEITFDKLNISIRSFTEVGGLIFPLKICIKDISQEREDIIDYKVEFISNKDDDFVYNVDTTQSPFYKEIEMLDLKQKTDHLFKFIDHSIRDAKGKSVCDYLNIYTSDDFFEFIVDNEFISIDNVIKMLYEVNFLVAKVKGMFLERAMDFLDWNRHFPNIKLKQESRIPESFKEATMYPSSMIGLQTVSEYPMEVWFSENVGKSYSEWSWREVELKKMYITMKTRIENFRELLKAKEMEDSMEKSRTDKRR